MKNNRADGSVFFKALSIPIGKKSKKKLRHPAGGYYWVPDYPGGKTPKEYKRWKPPVRKA